ncbi:hypothetical protein [Halopiger djelfimassiliensis]|uniref:hypothetical protein n=1 Tax=Halopiger djelfimassiliensis TaxID=1293047 RepID=UPI000677AF9E|nr:hypothetical protein [Halopiger djelfimassiliensis]
MSALVSDPLLATVLGVSWGLVLFAYGHIFDMGVCYLLEADGTSLIRGGIDILLVGGGTGLLVYLTDSLSAVRYGIAGVAFVTLAVTLYSCW